jgi:tetrahydromethanopterin S-methyltransferase subunit E
MNAAIDNPYETKPFHDGHLQWRAVLGAGFIAGLVLLIVPRASPWSVLTFFAPVVMGRVVPEELGMPVFLSKVVHMGLAMVYGFIISLVVMRIHQLRAVFAGAAIGLVL